MLTLMQDRIFSSKTNKQYNLHDLLILISQLMFKLVLILLNRFQRYPRTLAVLAEVKLSFC